MERILQAEIKAEEGKIEQLNHRMKVLGMIICNEISW